jgi:hypothetical protein
LQLLHQHQLLYQVLDKQQQQQGLRLHRLPLLSLGSCRSQNPKGTQVRRPQCSLQRCHLLTGAGLPSPAMAAVVVPRQRGVVPRAIQRVVLPKAIQVVLQMEGSQEPRGVTTILEMATVAATMQREQGVEELRCQAAQGAQGMLDMR